MILIGRAMFIVMLFACYTICVCVCMYVCVYVCMCGGG